MADFNIVLFLTSCIILCYGDNLSTTTYAVTGKVQIDRKLLDGHEGWLKRAHIFVNGGSYIAVPDRDGTFKVTGLSSASYVIEVSHPTFVFQPVRVDINSKGKMRARKLNHLQPNQVEQVEYPLVLRAQGKAPYFHKRDEWRITDMLKNPMVLMMVLPMILIFIMPKMMNAADDETKKEMEASMNKFSTPGANNMPDLSQALTNLLGAGASESKHKKRRSQK
ncbi:endoplasmic reticulum membrane protein complex subunit 7-like [Watersipora subatra]|uniref:endoplasmic reticulum membrane protein complex subunit 7-like n=1 Tax=Watersipora subatra TaxID=2589382 RepID=UPI00355C5992